MPLNSRNATVNFLWAYLAVTILAYSVSIATGIILDLPEAPPGASMFDEPAFVMTVRYHLLINLVVWSFFASRYYRQQESQGVSARDAMYLGGAWLVAAMFVDLVCFVLIKSPFSLTPHQFYVEYQPWISITYAIVLISPIVAYALIRRRSRPAVVR